MKGNSMQLEVSMEGAPEVPKVPMSEELQQKIVNQLMEDGIKNEIALRNFKDQTMQEYRKILNKESTMSRAIRDRIVNVVKSRGWDQ